MYVQSMPGKCFFSEEIYTVGQNFTLPLAVTNLTSDVHIYQLYPFVVQFIIHKQHINYLGTIWVPIWYYLGTIWVLFGDILRTICGLFGNYLGTFFDIIWILFGDYLGIIWGTIWGLFADYFNATRRHIMRLVHSQTERTTEPLTLGDYLVTTWGLFRYYFGTLWGLFKYYLRTIWGLFADAFNATRRDIMCLVHSQTERTTEPPALGDYLGTIWGLFRYYFGTIWGLF